MKKRTYIAISGAVLLLAAVCLAALLWKPSTPQTPTMPGIAVYDSAGEQLICLKETPELYDSEYWVYLELAVAEASQILAQQEKCSTHEAMEMMKTQGYAIHTAFDANAFSALQYLTVHWGSTCDLAGAVTDLNGALVAAHSHNVDGKQINYAQERRSPYSSFKALSVYTPAIERGVANWTTTYQDTPYKQLADETGTLQDWPANATGVYSGESVTVYEALRTSLNTAAVRCLTDVGVAESMQFLQESFGIPLKEEQFVIENLGPEEVIGNIALGYLETGITPVEMAGYYQIFGNGGLYESPKTVNKIVDADGVAQYTREAAPKQVISPAAADTMNKLLQGVVKPGGTGQKGYVSDVAVAGKTGTGDDYADNWFVGVTPGYSLALWHGQSDTNQAEEMFAMAVNKLYSQLPDANRKFVTHQNLYQIAYCVHSGKAFSLNCAQIDKGYFATKDALPVCDVCKKP